MRKKILWLPTAFLILLGLGMLSHVTAAETNLVSALTADFGPTNCGDDCDSCGWLWRDHKIEIGGDGTWWTHSCIPNRCWEYDELTCSPEGLAMEVVWKAVLAGDATVVQEALSSPDKWEYNSKRGALQMKGCSGAVVAHIPLEPGLAAAGTLSVAE